MTLAAPPLPAPELFRLVSLRLRYGPGARRAEQARETFQDFESTRCSYDPSPLQESNLTMNRGIGNLALAKDSGIGLSEVLRSLHLRI